MSKKRAKNPSELGRNASTVLQSELPTELLAMMRQLLQASQIKSGYLWVLERVNGEKSPLEILEEFLEQYEMSALKTGGNRVAVHIEAFRAALALRCIQLLPYFGVRFAEHGVNTVFLRTWLQKRLLSLLVGISTLDVEVKIRHSAKSPPNYLQHQLGELVPTTFLKDLRF